MRKRILAICGKGGTGKTLFTAATATVLLQTGKAGKLLLIDADPAMNLPYLMGAKVKRSMGDIREHVINTAREGSDADKEQLGRSMDYMVMEALTEVDDYAILAMGRTETLGCFCPLNDVLRAAVESLSASFDTIIIDGEAGLEQLNRQVMRRVDTLVVISDATSRGVRTAAIIKGMIEKDRVLQCDSLGLIFNRVQGNQDLLERQATDLGLDVFGYVPYDQAIAHHDLMGEPITSLREGPGLLAVRTIVEDVLFPSRFQTSTIT